MSTKDSEKYKEMFLDILNCKNVLYFCASKIRNIKGTSYKINYFRNYEFLRRKNINFILMPQ